MAKHKAVLQLSEMDDELRNGLWNVVCDIYLNTVPMCASRTTDHTEFFRFCRRLWDEVLKRPIDTIPILADAAYTEIRDYFHTTTRNSVYDFLEFIPEPRQGRIFRDRCNKVLERESSAYRFVGTHLLPITNASEMRAVDEAFGLPGVLHLASQHIEAAARHLANREAPDYRASIKESISAVESVCSLIAGQTKANLDAALQKLQSKLPLHAALRAGFAKLYGYTSDANGIRHALMDEPDVSFDDALYMLVTCSAFVNYLTSLATRAKIIS